MRSAWKVRGPMLIHLKGPKVITIAVYVTDETRTIVMIKSQVRSKNLLPFDHIFSPTVGNILYRMAEIILKISRTSKNQRGPTLILPPWVIIPRQNSIYPGAIPPYS